MIASQLRLIIWKYKMSKNIKLWWKICQLKIVTILIFVFFYSGLNFNSIHAQISHQDIVDQLSKKISTIKIQVDKLKNTQDKTGITKNSASISVNIDSLLNNITTDISRLDNKIGSISGISSDLSSYNTQVLAKLSSLENDINNLVKPKEEKKPTSKVEKAPGKFTPTNKVGGYVIADAYWIAGNHNESIKDQHGFWFRRIYLTFDQSISSDFSARVRFEMSQPGNFPEKGEKMSPVVKDAYLKWKLGKTQAIFGLSSTPTWGIVEKTWGYRSVEKTPLDLQKLGSSRDLGLAIKGQFDAKGLVKYHVMYGNGSSNKSETDKGKSWLASLSLYPTKEIVVEIYGDYRNVPDNNDIYTAQLFAAYKTKGFRAGIQFAHQTHKNSEYLSTEVASIFAAAKLSNNWSTFARIDKMFDANPSGHKVSYIPFDPTTKSTFIVAGLDYSLVKNVSILPNIEVVIYDKNKNALQPKTDVIPRMSFYYKF
jgi:hypothetical protein